MTVSITTKRAPWLYFVLVFALAAPFWAIGAMTNQGLLRDQGTNLPVSALAVVCPMLAALILVYREERFAGVVAFLRRVFDLKSIRRKIWYIPIIFLLPLLYALSYGTMRLLGVPLPAPQTSLLTILVLFGVFFISAAFEEAGWTGYAIDPLQARWGALGGAIIVGVVWAAIHIVPDLQSGQTWAWVAGQRCFTVALRVLIVWLYNNTGKSVLAAILAHDMDNVSVYSLFPNNGGSYYDPAITAALTAGAALVVTFLWGPRTLARFRFAPSQKPQVAR